MTGRIRTALRWAMMLTKRLYKKATFVLLLVSIPLAVFSVGVMTEEDSGFVSIVMAAEDPTDDLTLEVINELLMCDSVVRFTYADSEREAMEMLKTGMADEAWIFSDDLSGHIRDFAADPDSSEPFVRMVCREQTVFLRLSREKLSSALYKHIARAFYIVYARENVHSLDGVTDKELIGYFEDVSITDELFTYSSLGEMDGAADANEHYLTAPLRGLLGILIAVCGMSAALYHMQDEREGTYSLVSEPRRIYVAYASVFTAVFSISVVAFVSLLVFGYMRDIAYEALILAVYSVCVTAFCVFLKTALISVRLYAASIPVLTVVMIAVCPVFFDMRNILQIQHIFPPTYLVNAIYEHSYPLYMLFYCAVSIASAILLDFIARRHPFSRKNNYSE